MIERLENAFMTHLKQFVRIYNFLAQSTQEVRHTVSSVILSMEITNRKRSECN